MRMANYWGNRVAKAQAKATAQSIKETEKILRKYYASSAEKVLGQFEATYQHLLSSIEKGREPTPADLYKLDKYWQLQGQLRRELMKLGEKQVVSLTKQFEINFFEVYYSFALPSQDTFATLDKSMAHQMINSIWCADGKSWSSRIWGNINTLQSRLNENLIDCVISGKKTTELKHILQEQFDVSYGRADALVRTEMAHIQTQAAQKRYEDYGIQEVEVFVDEDERTCPICSKYEGKRYPVGAQYPVPLHPRCRCCMIPVID